MRFWTALAALATAAEGARFEKLDSNGDGKKQ